MNSTKDSAFSQTTIAISVNRKYTGKLAQDSPQWNDHTGSFQLETLNVTGIGEAVRQGYAIAAAHHTRRKTENYISAQHIGLDYDTEDERSRLDTLQADPFLSEYFAIFHTSSSHTEDAPRARVLAILDKPVRCPKQYVRYVRALLWRFTLADQKASDAARLWFGAVGCEIRVNESAVLPIAVLDALAEEYEKYLGQQERQLDFDPNIDADAALDNAIRQTAPGHRYEEGFKFYCQLRDKGLTIEQAIPYAQDYQVAVENVGDHLYTWTQAFASLRSAYQRKPRGHTPDQVDTDLSLFEWFGWYERIGAKQGATHYSLKTLMAVSDIAQKCGRTQGLDLSVRGFTEYGVKRMTAANHLQAMVDAGLLIRVQKSNYSHANVYSINMEFLRKLAAERQEEQPDLAFDVEQSATYHQLQGMCHFMHGARIDPRLWVGEPPKHGLGTPAQRILATLAESGDRGVVSNGRYARIGQTRKGYCPPLRVCPIRAYLGSLRQLFTLSGVSDRAGRKVFNTLVTLGICTWEYAPDNSSHRIPSFTDNWYERLVEIAPAFTTFGHPELLAKHYDAQRVTHHENYQRFAQKVRHPAKDTAPAKRNVSAKTWEKAASREAAHVRRIDELNRQRQSWANSQGITDSIPPVSLFGEGNKPQTERDPYQVRKAGRTLKTSGRVGKNGKLRSERADYVPPAAAVAPPVPPVVETPPATVHDIVSTPLASAPPTALAGRWLLVTKAAALRQELTKWAQASEEHRPETSRDAKLLLAYLNGASYTRQQAHNAAYGLGVHMTYGIQWGEFT